MTRKDYILIAKTLALCFNSNEIADKNISISRFQEALKSTNLLFDPIKFWEYTQKSWGELHNKAV